MPSLAKPPRMVVVMQAYKVHAVSESAQSSPVPRPVANRMQPRSGNADGVPLLGIPENLSWIKLYRVSAYLGI